MLLQIFMTLALLSKYIIINQLAFIGRTIFRYIGRLGHLS